MPVAVPTRLDGPALAPLLCAQTVVRGPTVRYDPENLSRVDVFPDGRPAGVATPGSR